MIRMLKRIIKTLTSQRWELGIVCNSLEDVVKGKQLDIRWIKNPYKNCWYADPFVLDVTDDEILLLVEDMPVKPYPATSKASISKLTIDRHSYKITGKDVILDLPTHLSFPNILRYNGKIYVYPENVFGGKLNIYEYDVKLNKLVFVKTLIDEPCWDSEITEQFNNKKDIAQPLCFTCKTDDYNLDVYTWNKDKEIFEYWQSISSDHRNMRMAGKFFSVGGKIYCPSQNSDRCYGNATEIKVVTFKNGQFSFNTVRTLKSTHPTLKEGMHTLNEYKGVIVVDAIGYNHPLIAKIIKSFKH